MWVVGFNPSHSMVPVCSSHSTLMCMYMYTAVTNPLPVSSLGGGVDKSLLVITSGQYASHVHVYMYPRILNRHLMKVCTFFVDTVVTVHVSEPCNKTAFYISVRKLDFGSSAQAFAPLNRVQHCKSLLCFLSSTLWSHLFLWTACTCIDQLLELYSCILFCTFMNVNIFYQVPSGYLPVP